MIPVRDAAGLPPMLRTLPAADEVIVVTAAPVPEAAVRAAFPGAFLVRQTRAGLGNALACGVAASTGDVVVTLDGDGATDPGEMRRYVEALMAGADMATGSRYREGGRDLTTGRFRRALNLTLAWLLNILYGVHRTDPGFGYAAYWREALTRLSLPDPQAKLPVWGDGPEIEALLTVRSAARGLAVTEVPGVAYPRMRRSAHHDRTTLRHWLRALTAEYRGRTRRPPRHSATPTDPPPAHAAVAGQQAMARPGLSRPGLSQPATRAVTPLPRLAPRSDRRTGPADSTSDGSDAATVHSSELSTGAPHDLRFSARIETGGGPRRVGKQEDQPAEHGHDRPGVAEPIWGPARRSEDQAHLWLADIPAPLDRPAPQNRPTPPDRPAPQNRPTPPDRPAPQNRPASQERPGPVGRMAPPPGADDRGPVAGSVSAPRDAGTAQEDAGSAQEDAGSAQEDAGSAQEEAAREDVQQREQEAPREVGARRRHLEGYRQRPDLRVINGEGSGGGRSRSGRLRAVPPRETTGGRPGPQQ